MIGQQQSRGHIHGGKEDHTHAEGGGAADIGGDQVAHNVGQTGDDPIGIAGVLQARGIGNRIDIYISDDHDDVLADGIWEQFFTEKPEVLTREEKREWLNTLKGVALGSDAFFPFGDNIERAHKTGVEYIAQAGGSVRDDHVIETCDKYGIAMAFTGIRLFHH